MQKATCAIVAIYCLLICTAQSQARHVSRPITPAKLFQDLYNNASIALSKRDIDGSMAYMDPDFVQVDATHTQNDVGMLRYRISAWLDDATAVHASTEVLSASIDGVNGTVMQRSVLSMVLINPDTRLRASFIYRYVARDKWAHSDDGWMMLRSEVISDSATLNGRRVYDKDDPFAPAPPPSEDANGNPIDDSGTASGSNSSANGGN
jgi:hypothetical protein